MYYTKKNYVNKGFLSLLNNCFTFWTNYAILVETAGEFPTGADGGNL